VTMLIANLASIPMQDGGIPLLSGLVPILTVLGIQLLLAVASMRWIPVRRVLCGKPVILISQGVIQQKNLRRTRITLDELTEHLRQREVLDLNSVQYAILETNGKISVFLYPKYRPASAKEAGIGPKEQSMPVTIVSDGKLLKHNLALAGKSQAWLGKELQSRQCPVREVYLLTVDSLDHVFFVRKEAGV